MPPRWRWAPMRPLAALAAAAQASGIDMQLVRIGSRGMVWLEPLVEVEVDGRRIGYGPVAATDVAALVAAGLFNGADHALKLGVVDELPFIAKQERLTFARVGLIDPVNLDDYMAHGGYVGLRALDASSGAQVVQQVTDSGLRGPWRRGLPHRHQVEDRARPAGGPEVRGLQCRRRRLRALSPIAC